MKTLLIFLPIMFLAGCGNVHHLKSGHLSTVDGVQYERQYWVIETEPKCTGSCLDTPSTQRGKLFDEYYQTYIR